MKSVVRKNRACSCSRKINQIECCWRPESAKKMVSKSSKVGHNKLVGRQRLMTPLDTLIVWTEPTNGVDMALSFQESEGCAAIWSVLNLRC
jgi:hypothetical protein